MTHDKSDDVVLSRRSAVLGAAGLAAGVIVAGVSASARAGSASGPLGTNGAANGLELLGEISQVADVLTGYGYFTAVSGLDDRELFFPGTPSEATARFTFHSTAHLTSIQRRGDVFVAHAEGSLTIYVRDTPGASFDDPSSFAQGHAVATDDALLENVTSVIAPNTAGVTVFGDLRRTAVSRFRLGAKTYQLGTLNLRSRLVAPGKGTRLDAVTPRAILVVGGNVTNPAPDHGGRAD